MRTKKTDKRVPEDGNDHQDFVPFIENNVEGESTPIESAENEHDKNDGKEWSWADLTEEEKEDHKQRLLSVCTNDEEKHVACLSEPEMQKQAQEKLNAKEYEGGLKIMQTWIQLHTRLAILVDGKK